MAKNEKNDLTSLEISKLVQFDRELESSSYLTINNGADTELLRELYRKGMVADISFRSRTGGNADSITLKRKNITEAGMRIIAANKSKYPG